VQINVSAEGLRNAGVEAGRDALRHVAWQDVHNGLHSAGCTAGVGAHVLTRLASTEQGQIKIQSYSLPFTLLLLIVIGEKIARHLIPYEMHTKEDKARGNYYPYKQLFKFIYAR
jgi:hypothetical protein